ncbi:unnamed protein product, partial [Symbiodinium sp. CCMP2456]
MGVSFAAASAQQCDAATFQEPGLYWAPGTVLRGALAQARASDLALRRHQASRGKAPHGAPAADCCVSGPLFFASEFLDDLESTVTAWPVKVPVDPLSRSVKKVCTVSRRAREKGPTPTGVAGPTRKHRTRRWRERVAESNRQFWDEMDGEVGASPPPPEPACALLLAPRLLPSSAEDTAGTAAALAAALHASPDWNQVEQLVLDFAETVEDQDEAGLAYRVAYDALDAKLRFVSANITTWSANIFKWHRTDKGPLLIQELHMGDEAVQKLKVDALSQGYHLFVPPFQGSRPTKGGVATLVPVHCQGRFRGGHLTE